MELFIIAQVCGFGAMCALFIGYQQKKRERLIVFKLIADVFWIAHYCLLGGYGGMIPNCIGIFRELIFVRREKDKWANNVCFPILFICCNLGLGILTFKSPINILPIVASCFVTLSLWLKKPNLTKLITIPVCAAFLVYDVFIDSYVGIANESLSIISIIISFIILLWGKRNMKDIFTQDFISTKQPIIYGKKPVEKYQAVLDADTNLNQNENALQFANDVEKGFFANFERADDKMCHVSTFVCVDGVVYVSYYASTSSGEECPEFQGARLAYCPIDEPQNKTILDIQGAGDTLGGRTVKGVYDTILMQKPDEKDNIYILWTADVNDRYYRLYRVFNTKTKTLGEIGVNRFKVGDIVNDFSSTGMKHALTENDIGYKEFFSDIGIMQKQSFRVEDGKAYCYTGTYSGNFTCIIKSKDLITWEYVAQPNEGACDTGFENQTKWENAVYVLDDKVYYFVRQWDPVYEDGVLKEGTPYGFLTVYDLITKEWTTPVLVGDCQSRSDFIYYKDNLYLFYAPTNREHIGILKVDTQDLSKTKIVLQADIKSSCFYPFVQYFKGDTLGMSYTVDRKHIRLTTFDLDKYL